MKVVIVTQGSLGDIRPFIAIGVSFRKQGHQITFCAPKNFQSLFSNYDFSYYPVGINFQSLTDNNKPQNDKKQVMQLLQQSISDQFNLLSKITKDANLIIGNGLDFAGRSIAEYHKVPYFLIVPMPLAFKSKYHAPMSIPFQKRPSWLNIFFWWINEVVSKSVFGKKINQYRLKLGLSKINNYIDFMSQNAILAANSVLAPLPPDCKNIYQSGFPDYDEGLELDWEIIDFINSGNAPIYIGFGSMTDSESASTSKFLNNLVQQSKHHFIISRGWANLRFSRSYSNVLFIDNVPHAKLFPLMSVIIHHGGAGTTSIAAKAGIPQIIVPYGMDQYYWGNRIMKLRIGIMIKKRKNLSVALLVNSINTIICNPEYNENAKRVMNLIKNNNGTEDAVNYILNKFNDN
jgi:vancomycin aglycone glucosyltransferase